MRPPLRVVFILSCIIGNSIADAEVKLEIQVPEPLLEPTVESPPTPEAPTVKEIKEEKPCTRPVRLRLKQGPTGTFIRSFRRRGSFEVQDVNATIRNTSSCPAEEDEVVAIYPDGQEQTMSGPTTIGRYQSARYEISKSQPIRAGGRLSLRFSCNNCR